MSLTPDLILAAYAEGLFPMADDDGEIGWYRPDPRAILPLETFHCPRSLARVVRSGRFEIHINRACEEVIRACAEPGPGREQTWLHEDIIQAFLALHDLGFVHSVECWRGDTLAGGLYGLSIRGFFAGESMFTRVPDAGKTALVRLVEHMRTRGMTLLDVQFVTDHLRRFGVIEIPAADYEARLRRALRRPAGFLPESAPGAT